MGSASKYWYLVQIDGSGRQRSTALAIAQTFLQQECAELLALDEVPDNPLQIRLLEVLRSDRRSAADQDLAELCLRCFISSQVEQMCIRLEQNFGFHYGFTRYDLFPLVLDDDGKLRSQRRTPTTYRSLATTILETFDPSRASLSTWTMRLVRNYRELNQFLRECGVYLASDWSILNDTSPEQAQRILLSFHALTAIEVERSSKLLQAYHLVYRQDRLQLRRAGIVKGKEQCKPPTPEQLIRIADYYQQLTTLPLSPQIALKHLQTLATQVRQYRVAIRSGSPPTSSLDEPETQTVAIALPAPDAETNEEQNEFLMFYREQFLQCLDESLEQATNERFTYLQRKKGQKGEPFLKALQLFHCQGQAMGEIATQVGLAAQFEVSRLMKLKEFRASVRQYLLALLSDRILHKAKTYVDAQQLHNLDQRIEVALNEQIETVIQQAEAESVVTKHRPLESLFARRLCRHLDTRRTAV
ncbi:hypothetical protein H6G89_18565 [Oscillatoria sp. FACHB-1407]|uniref:hypothetical protein n=1 Tax=Oscillatoria sp. FACHB-1407 TaxID=2692847 RepID=UPI00168284E0|nr:hypothetical protein [Oscillatoria sp. FACHB-1407]MBD2463044.1 hypothetical protein [Oscillatoria sp. FACHB-1407]